MLVTVTDCDCLAPTLTLPKSSLPGLSVSVPEAVAVPVPESASSGTVLDASLVMETVLLKVPAALGVNLILIVALCPAVTVTGRLGETREKYLVEIVTLLTVTDAGPEFVAVAVRVLLLPSVTLPKSSVAFSRERVVDCCWLEEPALKPWQLIRKVRPARRTNAPAAFQMCLEEIALAAVSNIVSHGPVAPGSTTVF